MCQNSPQCKSCSLDHKLDYIQKASDMSYFKSLGNWRMWLMTVAWSSLIIKFILYIALAIKFAPDLINIILLGGYLFTTVAIVYVAYKLDYIGIVVTTFVHICNLIITSIVYGGRASMFNKDGDTSPYSVYVLFVLMIILHVVFIVSFFVMATIVCTMIGKFEKEFFQNRSEVSNSFNQVLVDVADGEPSAPPMSNAYGTF